MMQASLASSCSLDFDAYANFDLIVSLLGIGCIRVARARSARIDNTSAVMVTMMMSFVHQQRIE